MQESSNCSIELKSCLGVTVGGCGLNGQREEVVKCLEENGV